MTRDDIAAATGLCECGCGGLAPIAAYTATKWGAVKGQPRRFIQGHSGHRWAPGEGALSGPRLLPSDWRQRITVTDSGCWIWPRTNDQGYGLYSKERAHRVAYRTLIAEIPDGLVLDHVCHNNDLSCRGGKCLHRACINPAHLEPTTLGINTRRGRGPGVTRERMLARTHCAQGHEWTPENTIVTPRQRKCRECGRLQSQRNNAKRRGTAS